MKCGCFVDIGGHGMDNLWTFGELCGLFTSCNIQLLDKNMRLMFPIVYLHVMYLPARFENVLPSVCGDMWQLVQIHQIYQHSQGIPAFVPFIGKICKK